jgi:diadenosine tetraphosphate (Ap4A) HIT family hydrolase
MFELHPKLAADTHLVGDLPLCRVLLMNDSAYPWLILVPRRQGLRDLSDLHQNDLDLLWPELIKTESTLRAFSNAEKMNVGALGNLVPQLHIHIIARFAADAAWPSPVWGKFPPMPYDGADVRRLTRNLRELLDIAAYDA